LPGRTNPIPEPLMQHWRQGKWLRIGKRSLNRRGACSLQANMPHPSRASWKARSKVVSVRQLLYFPPPH